MSESWIEVCAAGDIDEEDVMRFDHDGATYAVYRTAGGYFATDGLCTHETAHLADGLVLDDIIECPLHQGRFHIPTGRARGAPVCEDLQIYAVKVAAGSVFMDVGGATT